MRGGSQGYTNPFCDPVAIERPAPPIKGVKRKRTPPGQPEPEPPFEPQPGPSAIGPDLDSDTSVEIEIHIGDSDRPWERQVARPDSQERTGGQEPAAAGATRGLARNGGGKVQPTGSHQVGSAAKRRRLSWEAATTSESDEAVGLVDLPQPRGTMEEQAGTDKLIRPKCCAFCFGHGHRNKIRPSGPECPSRRRHEQLAARAARKRVPSCTYRLCARPNSHSTRACPYLLDRCQRCGCRGHREDTFKCDPRDPFTMHYLREKFEECADRHFYARQRVFMAGLGFYPVAGDPSQPSPLPYHDLIHLPVLEACHRMDSAKYPALLPERAFNRVRGGGGKM